MSIVGLKGMEKGLESGTKATVNKAVLFVIYEAGNRQSLSLNQCIRVDGIFRRGCKISPFISLGIISHSLGEPTPLPTLYLPLSLFYLHLIALQPLSFLPALAEFYTDHTTRFVVYLRIIYHPLHFLHLLFYLLINVICAGHKSFYLI